jgi:hypothetical protein
MMDDTIQVYEPPVRNSGIAGGKFLERQKVGWQGGACMCRGGWRGEAKWVEGGEVKHVRANSWVAD